MVSILKDSVQTLRLHPPLVMLTPWETVAHCKIGGYDVYPKTRIHINVWVIGKDPRVWDNLEEFNPERFMNSDIDFRGQHFALVPLGAGRRLCLGMNIATTIMELTLANLLYSFD
ncbi:hypothetical protein VitviT2T_005904 [Vitis vinifera]|uniref:Uncharacterized protein n=2 Tax=Vitis vinifera TaxID=29760 RepID=A0ABY9BW25_VITVI|nr:hypothetical protein VitviT2T_005904 [Vitis vinifera]